MTELERSVFLVGPNPYESSGIDSLGDDYQHQHHLRQQARPHYSSSSLSASSPVSASSWSSSQLLYCTHTRPGCGAAMFGCRPFDHHHHHRHHQLPPPPIDLSPSPLSARSVYQSNGITVCSSSINSITTTTSSSITSSSKPISLSPPFNGSFQFDSTGQSPTVCVTNISITDSSHRPLTDYSSKLSASSVSRAQDSKCLLPVIDPAIHDRPSSTEMATNLINNEGRTTMSRFLDRIDGSSSAIVNPHSPTVTSQSVRNDDIVTNDKLESTLCSSRVFSSAPHSGQHLVPSQYPYHPQHYLHPSRYHVPHPQVMPVSAQSPPLPPLAVASSTTNNSINNNNVALSCSSSPLRSSRSFTAIHRQRPNVTLIRRKSASERLAESKCRYIRSATCNVVKDTDETHLNFDCIELHTDYNLVSSCLPLDRDSPPDTLGHSMTMKLLRETPTSTKSSQTSSSLSPCLRFSPIQDVAVTVNDDRYSNNNNNNGHHNLMHNNLVDKINSQLNRPKQYNISPTNGFNNPKKRVSPKLSESSTSNGTSNLEMQLRELIGMDTGNDPDLNEQINNDQVDNVVQPKPTQSANKVEEEVLLQKEREANNIYRAELKYICSSSSSLSSDYSERHPSLSPIEQNHPKSNIKVNFFNDSGDRLIKCALTPSVDEKSSIVVRSKSDVSVKNKVMNEYNNDSNEQVERLIQSLGLDSDSYRAAQDKPIGPHVLKPISQISNLQNYTESSCSNDSLDKLESLKKTTNQVSKIRLDNQSNPSTPKSSSTNDLLSLNSLSQLSVSKAFSRNQLNHSKSTSKLTFQNLMIHQQSLTPSRSCHNLIASFQSGPSVVERNARIIKWLYNCRKAMNQMDTSISTFN